MASYLDLILGLGYAGYASLNGTVLPLLPSQPEESENLYRSQGAVSSQVQGSSGEVPHRNRRQTTFHLTTDLTQATASLVALTTISWRLLGQAAVAFPCQVVVANGEGYNSPEAYVEEAVVTVPHEGPATVTFTVFAFRWTPMLGTTTPPTQQVGNFFNIPQYQPIPGWDTTVTHSGQYGDTREFSFSLKNGFQFRHLLEVTPFPPTPRVVTASPLFYSLTLTTVAYPNSAPSESGACFITLGGGSPGATMAPQMTFSFPLLYREPSRSYNSLGSQDGLVEWTAQWFGLGAVPTAV